MKITKKHRERAALVCALGAANNTSTWEAAAWLYGRGTVRSEFVGDIARAALAAVPQRFDGSAAYACAESMLRTGWTP